MSTAVQPNRVQQILYASTLQPYICGELIGKTLVDKTAAAARIILTDSAPALDLRLRVEVPVVWLAGAVDPVGASLAAAGLAACPKKETRGPVLCHPRFPQDVAAARDILGALEGTLDVAEPFARIREAMAEARKMGVTKAA